MQTFTRGIEHISRVCEYVDEFYPSPPSVDLVHGWPPNRSCCWSWCSWCTDTSETFSFNEAGLPGKKGLQMRKKGWTMTVFWVDWNMFFFPHIGNNGNKWLMFFRGVGIPPARWIMANSWILLNECEDKVEIYETVDLTATRLVSIRINYNDFVRKGSRPNFENNHPKITRVRNGISQSHPKKLSHPEISQVRNLVSCMQ